MISCDDARGTLTLSHIPEKNDWGGLESTRHRHTLHVGENIELSGRDYSDSGWVLMMVDIDDEMPWALTGH